MNVTFTHSDCHGVTFMQWSTRTGRMTTSRRADQSSPESFTERDVLNPVQVVIDVSTLLECVSIQHEVA